MLTQFGRNQFNTGLGQQIGDQALVARLVFAGQNHRFAHPVTLHKTSLYLTGLNTEATQFNLIVIAAEIVDVAIEKPAAEVAGFIHARVWIGGERIGNEALGGQFGTVQVATGDAGTGNIDFAGHTEGSGLIVGIENIDPGISDRTADGNRVSNIDG